MIKDVTSSTWARPLAFFLSALMVALPPLAAEAQQPPPAAADQDQAFTPEQLDALLAPIALYPDNLLTQTLMAAAYPTEIVEASRWLDQPGNKALSGDQLAQALDAQNWDPSVKATVAVPQVLATMNANLEWTQQLGYAFDTQQPDVLASVQRLRQQAQAANQLQSTQQQVVTADQGTIIIQPAQPNVVYVPVYNPTVVYGTWLYPAYPPVYILPPPGYIVGDAYATGLVFGIGIAITASLWDIGRPDWRGRNVNVDVNRYNRINVRRPPIAPGGWRPGGGRPAFNRPPTGPVGRPGGPPRPGGPGGGGNRPGIPASPGGINRPGGPSGGPARPGGPGGGGGNRPGIPASPGGFNRPGGPSGGPANGRPNISVPGNLVNRPQRPANPPPALGTNRPAIPALGNRPGGGAPAPSRPARPSFQPPRQPGGAIGGINEGHNASDFAARGNQSRQQMQRPAPGGGRPSGGGGHPGGGGGHPSGGGNGKGKR